MMVAMFVRMFMVVSFAVLMFVMMPFAMIVMVLVVMFHVTFFVSVHMVGAFFTVMCVDMNVKIHSCDAVGISLFNMAMHSFQVHGVNCGFQSFAGCA